MTGTAAPAAGWTTSVAVAGPTTSAAFAEWTTAPAVAPGDPAERCGWSGRSAPDVLADLAVRALRDEAELTPKPGLVDRRGGGAHADMDLAMLLASAEALRPAFEDLARAGAAMPVGTALRARVGAIGRAGERRMLRVTGGVNTHRGALWALGLLVTGAASHVRAPSGRASAAARVLTVGVDVPAVATAAVAAAAALARLDDPGAPARTRPSHGELVRHRHGAPGAAGEARAGFPHVTRVALPALRSARARGAGEEHARLDALLAVMARLADTCVLHRGGPDGLHRVRAGAAGVLAAGGTAHPAGAALLRSLDDDLRAHGLSPGGSADLLAAALLLDAVTHPREAPTTDPTRGP